ncbi:MAG: DNA-deoxyinosine glycosylase [Oscillospiraceae bacterium]|nr:DNA-deoxyinosine glycosylase [Oscillospiraceae bacterium]
MTGKNGYLTLEHTFPPEYDENSEILILGSFPSVRSREVNFYYGHPKNRFWPLIADIFGEDMPSSVEEKKALLQRNRIALWDVIARCEIIGSSDSSIRNVEPNDINLILNSSKVGSIYTNGRKAYDLYNRYCLEKTEREAVLLPSTSPANAAFTYEKLREAWAAVRDPL